MVDNVWKAPTPIANAYTDEEPALTGDGTNLYLAFKKLNTRNLYLSKFSDDAWSNPVQTNISTDESPALAWTGSALYMFWQSWDGKKTNKHIDFGLVNTQTGNVTNTGQVNGAKSGNGPGAVWWNSQLNVAHTGDVSSSIYYDQGTVGSGVSWFECEPKNKKSKKQPALAAAGNTLYMFHTGEGTKSKDVMLGTHGSGSGCKDWSDDNSVPDAKTKATPGAAGWLSQYIVLSHNGEDENHLLWHYLDIANNVWHNQGTIGNILREVKSKYAPALWYLPTQPKTAKSKSGMYLVYAENEHDSDQLNWTYLPEIE